MGKGPSLPVAPGDSHVATFESLGWAVRRRHGSHVIMVKDGESATLSIPCHRGQDLRRGTLGSLVRAAGLTVEEYCEAFGR